MFIARAESMFDTSPRQARGAAAGGCPLFVCLLFVCRLALACGVMVCLCLTSSQARGGVIVPAEACVAVFAADATVPFSQPRNTHYTRLATRGDQALPPVGGAESHTTSQLSVSFAAIGQACGVQSQGPRWRFSGERSVAVASAFHSPLEHPPRICA